jgi:hypothetical protein
VNREVVEHRRDPEHVDISLLSVPACSFAKKPPHASSTQAIATSSENSRTPFAANHRSKRRQYPRYHFNVDGW